MVAKTQPDPRTGSPAPDAPRPEPSLPAEAPASGDGPTPAAGDGANSADSAGAAPRSAAVRPPPMRRGRGFRLLLVLLLIVAAGLGYGGYWWMFLRGTISTDDAYVDARIVSVAARISERVDAVLAREGDEVPARSVLARFAKDKLELSVREAMADVRAAEAALAEARNSPRPEEIEVARAEVRVHEVDLDLQQKELERAKALIRVHAISDQELERRRSAVATARSRLDVARRQLRLLQAGSRAEQIDRAEAALAQARARLGAARADLVDAELIAPVAGTVARRMVDPGEVVQKGQALFQIVESGHSWVVANLEEDQITQVREGQPVRIWVDAYPGREFRGKVGPVYAATLSRFSLLPTSSASGSFIKVTQRVPVRIDWDEAELPPLYPGLNVVVRVSLTAP